MKQLIFKVSAKTARLFGRENASNAEAAISELVKNTYDADATACLLCFLPRYRSAPTELASEEYNFLREKFEKIEEIYCVGKNGLARLHTGVPNARERAENILKSLVDIWILDNGSGMTAKTIEECWMVIGTNDKEINVISQKGRARTGAKGIGRFALDRLGNRCTLYSSASAGEVVRSIRWEVDWRDFDGEGKTLDDISANMDEEAKPITDVLNVMSAFTEVQNVVDEVKRSDVGWNTGTAIRIGFLRDNWTKRSVEHLNKTLGALIPPVEQKELSLYLFDASSPGSYGLVSSEILEDYDYKVDAVIESGKKIKFTLFRNELDRERIDPDLFHMDEMKGLRFGRKALSKREISFSEDMEALFPEGDDKFFRQAGEI